MQIFGLLMIIGVVGFGFIKRESAAISFFDPHALFMILGGTLGAVFLGSKPKNVLQTFSSLKQLLPFISNYGDQTTQMEQERRHIEELWISHQRAKAIEISEKSTFDTSKMMVEQVISRSHEDFTNNRFLALIHRTSDSLEGSINNWELMSKLGPSFGIVGTITGMVQIFQEFGQAGANIGQNMSLALLATLYGIAFGAGIAGPIASYMSHILEERLSVIDRCQVTTRQLVNLDRG